MSDYIEQKYSDDTMQNRDILKWVDRIERAKKFSETAQLFIDDVGTTLTTDALNLFKSIWATVYEEQCSPRGLVVSSTIVSPYIKKILPDGEAHFSYIKEYPFYYVLHLNTSFMMNAATENMRLNHEYFGEWYSHTMSSIFETQLTTRLKTALLKLILLHFQLIRKSLKKERLILLFQVLLMLVVIWISSTRRLLLQTLPLKMLQRRPLQRQWSPIMIFW